MEIRTFFDGRDGARRSIVIQHEDSLNGVCFVPQVPIYRAPQILTSDFLPPLARPPQLRSGVGGIDIRNAMTKVFCCK